VRISPVHPDNFGARRGVAIDRVILHTTEGSARSALGWFADSRAKSSAHYLVTKAGEVVELVDEEDCAYHAGNLAWNRSSIGIEMEGRCAEKATFTAEMLRALVELCGGICERHGLTPDPSHFYGHDEVPNPHDPKRKGGAHGHTDPGPFFPWAFFFTSLAQRRASLPSEPLPPRAVPDPEIIS
jgi:N-acetyl-anhydromuramyl-L-alanine amidase AmpD